MNAAQFVDRACLWQSATAFLLVIAFLHTPPCARAEAATSSVASSSPEASAAQVATADDSREVVLLVHGLTFGGPDPQRVWGRWLADEQCWSGLIGHLQSEGYHFGGTIRPDGGAVQLPKHLDRTGVDSKSNTARVFSLLFSEPAQHDGLALKALEVAGAARQLREFTGAGKVQIVAFSAGGLASRVWLQGALPEVPYRGEVSRLITIATPHLGSHLAHHLGDLLGTRATSLDHDGHLIGQLNQTLPLPNDVDFAAIVVRGIGADARGQSDEYDALLDVGFCNGLPDDFRSGGDQVVHVCSQNLALAKTARRYEAEAGRPVQFFAVRVDDPSPGVCVMTDDCPLAGALVHSAAAHDDGVLELVTVLLEDDGGLWKGLDEPRLAEWVERRARRCAEGAIERAGFSSHPLCDVDQIELATLELLEADCQQHQYRWQFTGQAHSRRPLIRCLGHDTQVAGTLLLTCDAYGRVLACQAELSEGDKWRCCRKTLTSAATLATSLCDSLLNWDW